MRWCCARSRCRTPKTCSCCSGPSERKALPRSRIPITWICATQNRSFESLVSYDIVGGMGLDTGSGNPSVVWPYMVSGNYFDSLGIQPYLGRFLHASDEHGKNSVPFIVLSYAYWHSHFNGDPAAVGRTVQINKHPYTIAGVAPADFRGTELFFAPDLLGASGGSAADGRDGTRWSGAATHFTWVIGHLKPGVTTGAATSDLNAIAASLAKSYPKEDDGLKFTLARPGLVGDTLGRPARAFMAGLMLLAGLILLAACANLGSLFAARAADRSREIALRMALGARRQLILRQLFTEALLVSLAGGVCGIAGAVAILARVEHLAAYPRHTDQCAGEPGCNNLRRGASACPLQRFVVRLGSGSTGAARRSLADDPFGLFRPRQRAPLYAARRAAGPANRHLRGSGYRLAGGGARPGAVAAKQLWLPAAGSDAGPHRSEDGWLRRRSTRA